MPSEQQQTASQAIQAHPKACVACQRPLSPPEDDIAALLLLSSPHAHDALSLCTCCRDGPSSLLDSPLHLQQRTQRGSPDSSPSSLHDLPSDSPSYRSTRPPPSPIQQRSTAAVLDPILSPESFPSLLSFSSPESSFPPLPTRPLPIPAQRSASLFIDTSPSSLPTTSSTPPTFTSALSPISFDHNPKSPLTPSSPHHAPKPDPLTDISHIRMRTQTHHCLYPGSTFKGTQKSGRNSYDVIVTIVNVDFAASHLCGYLCIRGLTEDWPELTTYFDAELIGARHGFLTNKWGSTEEDDMVHWGRFPAFRHIKNKLRGPHLTTDADPGAVFMRWKERFLVPDHRVQDINGASFAGFYYVCVDFNSPGNGPAQPASSSSCAATTSPARTRAELPSSKPEAAQVQSPPRRARAHAPRADSAAKSNAARSPSAGARTGPAVATMSGFYFHQHSEPYQQLSLKHVPERISTSFELR